MPRKEGITLEGNMRTADSLIQSILSDEMPSGPACADYGIRNQEIYQAYYAPVRAGELTADQLHRAVMGKKSGETLTKLLSSCPSNKGKDIKIKTLYDMLGM